MGNSNSSSRRFSSCFESGDVIGKGTFAIVKKCLRKSDKKEFAVKIIDKRQLTGKELVLLTDEVKMLQTIDHPWVIKMCDVFDNENQVKMVLELCEGGNLFDLVTKSPNHCLEEPLAAKFTAIIAISLKYLHSHNVVHRDLKPENILFTRDGTLKITDFGLAHYAKVTQDHHYMHTCCGTPHYVAPEILTSNGMEYGQYSHYSCQVDYWSLGVIVFIMLSGCQPFNSRSINGMYQLIIHGDYQFKSPRWDGVSYDAIDCIKKLMCVDPNQRMSCEDVLNHSWITKNVDVPQLLKEEIKNESLKQLSLSLKKDLDLSDEVVGESRCGSNGNQTDDSQNNDPQEGYGSCEGSGDDRIKSKKTQCGEGNNKNDKTMNGEFQVGKAQSFIEGSIN